MKGFFLALSFAAISVAIWAVPAERSRLKVRLVDGTEVYVTARGDEHLSWFQTDDGEVVEPADGQPGLYVKSRLSLQQTLEEASTRRLAARHVGTHENAPLPSEGHPKIPVVLVSFQDSVFHVGQTDEEVRAFYDLFCNGTRDGKRYTKHGSYGSIRDYFLGQSDSVFQPEFVVIGPVKLSNPVVAYGKNSGSSKDTGYSQFRKEAITKATALYDGDWSDFDNKKSGNGNVDLIFFIFAGCGENTMQTNPDLIGPKELNSPFTTELDDGTKLTFANSACCSENQAHFTSDGNVTGKTDGIGVMCHELSHALGLPDFYDTNYIAFGMDVWSIMDYGCYMSNSYAPVGYTAYERDFMGWRKLQELTNPGFYTLNPIASPEGVGFKVVNPANRDEYYILEARLKSNWDSALSRYGHGMQVTHVDYQRSAWTSNSVNTNRNHQRMTIIAANNNYQGSNTDGNIRETWAGNLYPYVYTDELGEHRNDSLTAASTPAATVFTASGQMPHSITDITLINDEKQIRFLFDGGLYDAVRDLHERSQASRSASAPWLDLNGRPAKNTSHTGVYVVGGKKVVVQ